jgi:hypothetical protein
MRRMFTSPDDEELKMLVASIGENSWGEVARRMTQPFSPRQCRERWRNYLDPRLQRDRWSDEDDLRLVQEFDRFPSRWALIAGAFPGRSGNDVRNRFLLLQRKRQNNERRNRRKREESQADPGGDRMSQIMWPVLDRESAAAIDRDRAFSGMFQPGW